MAQRAPGSATPYRIFVGVATGAAVVILILLQVPRGGGPEAGPGPSPTPTGPRRTLSPPPPSPPAPPVGPVLYRHDFSSPSNGLLSGAASDTGSNPYGSRVAEYTGAGTLSVQVTSSIPEFVGGGNTEQVVAGGRSLAVLGDVSVEVDARPVDTGGAAGWGLACRRDRGVGRFYFASVSLVDGQASASIIRQDEPGIGWVRVATAPVPPSIAIVEGVTNRLRLDCIGRRIALYADGTLVVEGSDASYPSGGIAVFVQPIPGGAPESTARVEFDNFVIRAP